MPQERAIAHDLNNLLILIAGNAEALGTTTDLRTVWRAAAEIEEAAQRATRLMQGLLTHCSQVPGRVVDVAGAVERLLALLRRVIPRSIEVQVENGRQPLIAGLDSGQLDQILINLALNARDAMPEVGTLTLRTGALELGDDDRELALSAGSYVYLAVADTGCGMSEATRALIFDPAYTTKPNGTGLGLATVRGIVRSAGGGLRVESEPGAGSTFTVYLPAAG